MIGFEVRDRFFLLRLYRFQLLMRFVQSQAILHVADALIDVGDLGLVRLEISVGLEIVIDCRHEACASRYIRQSVRCNRLCTPVHRHAVRLPRQTSCLWLSPPES